MQFRKFKVKKNSTLKQFKAVAAEAVRIPEKKQRYWTCPVRRNRTIRPDEPLSAQEEEECALEELVTSQKDLTVFLDAPGKVPRSSEALLFFKYYDPEAEEKLRFVCSLVVKIADPIASVLPHLRRALGSGPEQELLLFEEIKPSLVERLEDIKTTTFAQAELSNGDIICVQRTLAPDRRQACNLAPAHYARLLEVTVRFCNLNKQGEDVCALKLSRTAMYEEVIRALAKHLKHEPGKLRITQHSAMYNGPHVQPIDHNCTMALTNMLTALHSPKGLVLTDVLYFEKLQQARD
jgi:ubiquitin carboxyl-terminal hydrolase 7